MALGSCKSGILTLPCFFFGRIKLDAKNIGRFLEGFSLHALFGVVSYFMTPVSVDPIV